MPVFDPTCHTYHHGQFDLAKLVARKQACDQTVTVIVPARNEAATITAVVEVLVRLRKQTLVDEVLVVDSYSTDETAGRAAAAGARVVAQSRGLWATGQLGGKGEALWQGLASSTGTLVVHLDADVEDLDQHYVTGLLGPLLCHREVALVKAAYDRPEPDRGVARGRALPGAGGRVTELLARPLLATFWPELAWIVQPLAGEIAGRRHVLERLRYPSGYGIELAMLLDIAEGYGAAAIAQVDLGQRSHQPQALPALGIMATEILHIAIDRLHQQHRDRLPTELPDELIQPARSRDGALTWTTRTVPAGQHPPLVPDPQRPATRPAAPTVGPAPDEGHCSSRMTS